MILVVEDEPELLELCRTILEKFGYTVLAASQPHEALQIAHEHAEKIALLISDMVMPEMNGRDLSDRVRALCPQLNILFMSGYTADVIAHRGMVAEEVHFTAKPFSATDLVDKVQAL
jgi:CheY-like chemotaxis protein